MQSRNRFQIFEQLYQKCENEQQQFIENVIRSLLKDTIVCTKHKYIILNALNECIDRENFIVFIRELIHLQHENFRIMITSRSKKNIEKQLNSIANYDINIQSIIVNENIRIYVRNRLVTNSKLKK